MAPIGHFEIHYKRCAGDLLSNFPSGTLNNSAILIRIFALDQIRSWDLPKITTALIIRAFHLNYLSRALRCHSHISFCHSHLHISCWFMFCAERQ
jgi:hypothetical protein